MKLIKTLIVFIVFIVNINASQRISLRLDWLYQFQFAGYIVAKEKGFYKDQNLDVAIKEYNEKVSLADDIVNGKDTYGVAKSSIVLDALRGKRIILLSAIYQKSPIVLISLEKSNIKNIKDLRGKRISLTKDDSLTASVNSMLISNGVKLDEVRYVPDTFSVDGLIEDKADAKLSFLSNEPYVLEQMGIKYRLHDPSEFGFNFYGGLLFTSQDELENHPQRVKKFKDASLKGWKWAFEHIEQTAKLIYDKYNTQNKSLDALVYEGKVLKKLSGYDAGILGHIDEKRLEELKSVYALLSLDIKPKQHVSEFMYSYMQVRLSKKEKEYLNNNTIRLLSDMDCPPLTYKGKNNKPMGLSVEYFRLINKNIQNKNYTIEEKINKEALEAVGKDKNSVKFSFSVSSHVDNLQSTIPIFEVPIALATLKDKPFVSNISLLKDKKIGILKNVAFYEKLKNSYPELSFVSIGSFEIGAKKLHNNEIFAIAGKLPRLSYFISENSGLELKISGTFKESYKAAILVNKKNKILKNILNKAIQNIVEQDKKELNSKYYHVVYKTNVDYGWVYNILLPLLLVLLILLFVNARLKKEIRMRKKLEKELQAIADFDFLTKAYNRRKIEEIFEQEIQRAKRYERSFSMVFFDIDNFKSINDELGHKAGDGVLQNISKLILSSIRKTDYFGRWGGEEFIVLLPETDNQNAKKIALELKKIINNHDFNIQRKITCSFGVSTLEDTDTLSSIVKRADEAMYYVKKNGKNGVKVG